MSAIPYWPGRDLCIRCGERPVYPIDWLHCEPCWKDQAHEAALAWIDVFHERMEREGIDFVTAVEREAEERGLR